MSNIRTVEQKIRKMLNEEKTIVNLELAVKIARFQKENELQENNWN
jgi:hypothetical protein